MAENNWGLEIQTKYLNISKDTLLILKKTTYSVLFITNTTYSEVNLFFNEIEG
ncbi:MAG: hypothetical protein AB1467_06555 [Candidatus Diapherotrites archaeon]